MSYNDVIALPLNFIWSAMVVGITWAILFMATRIK